MMLASFHHSQTRRTQLQVNSRQAAYRKNDGVTGNYWDARVTVKFAQKDQRQ